MASQPRNMTNLRTSTKMSTSRKRSNSSGSFYFRSLLFTLGDTGIVVFQCQTIPAALAMGTELGLPRFAFAFPRIQVTFDALSA